VFRPEGGEDERESLDSKLIFLLATVGYAVGVLFFSYFTQKNGCGLRQKPSWRGASSAAVGGGRI
jgi:hypothetical protein